jgi:hypothetical protein
VNQRQLVLRGRARADANQPRSIPEAVAQDAQPVGSLGVATPGIVAEHPFVEDDPGSSCHHRRPSRSRAPRPILIERTAPAN